LDRFGTPVGSDGEMPAGKEGAWPGLDGTLAVSRWIRPRADGLDERAIFHPRQRYSAQYFPRRWFLMEISGSRMLNCCAKSTSSGRGLLQFLRTGVAAFHALGCRGVRTSSRRAWRQGLERALLATWVSGHGVEDDLVSLLGRREGRGGEGREQRWGRC